MFLTCETGFFFFFEKCTCHSLQLSKYFIEQDSGIVRDSGTVCGWMR